MTALHSPNPFSFARRFAQWSLVLQRMQGDPVTLPVVSSGETVTGEDEEAYRAAIARGQKLLTIPRRAERLSETREGEERANNFSTLYSTTREELAGKQNRKKTKVKTEIAEDSALDQNTSGARYTTEYRNKIREGKITADYNVGLEREEKDEAIKAGLKPLANSDVLFFQYRKLERVDAPLRKLKRSTIINKATLAVFRVVRRNHRASKEQTLRLTKEAAPDDFAALLGTDNGIAGVFLLTDWGAELQISDIDAVEVKDSAMWILYR